MAPYCDAVIVAAGSGTRLGFQQPKALVPLADKPMLIYSIAVFSEHPAIDNIILVVSESMVTAVQKIGLDDNIAVVIGGSERWQSVRNGCAQSSAEWVLVHDAARPFITSAVIDSLLDKKLDYDCAITATPVVDTIRTYTHDRAGDTIDRSSLIRVGTPQLFRRNLLNEGFAFAENSQEPPTDEAMLMQALHTPVGIAWGDPKNFKITTAEDLEIAEAIIKNNRRKKKLAPPPNY